MDFLEILRGIFGRQPKFEVRADKYGLDIEVREGGRIFSLRWTGYDHREPLQWSADHDPVSIVGYQIFEDTAPHARLGDPDFRGKWKYVGTVTSWDEIPKRLMGLGCSAKAAKAAQKAARKLAPN